MNFLAGFATTHSTRPFDQLGSSGAMCGDIGTPTSSLLYPFTGQKQPWFFSRWLWEARFLRP